MKAPARQRRELQLIRQRCNPVGIGNRGLRNLARAMAAANSHAARTCRGSGARVREPAQVLPLAESVHPCSSGRVLRRNRTPSIHRHLRRVILCWLRANVQRRHWDGVGR